MIAIMKAINSLRRAYLRAWSSLNYRYCRANAYLPAQRHEPLIAVGWSQMSADWQEMWRRNLR